MEHSGVREKKRKVWRRCGHQSFDRRKMSKGREYGKKTLKMFSDLFSDVFAPRSLKRNCKMGYKKQVPGWLSELSGGSVG